MEELLFMQLRVKIVELSEFINDKRNLHQTTKSIVRAISLPPNKRVREKDGDSLGNQQGLKRKKSILVFPRDR